MPTQTLQILGSYGFEPSIEFAEIQRDFGDGFDANELVGNSAGQKFYNLNFEFLPDTLDLPITDPEDMVVKSYARYLWDFYVRRKVDGEAFNITDARDGATVLVKFVEKRLTYQLFQFKLFSSGVQLKQHRT